MIFYKRNAVSTVALIATVSMLIAVAAFAMEPLDIKRISDDDKIFFASRLHVDQIEKLSRIINHDAFSKLPCEKVAEINKTLGTIKAVTPIFREASASGELSAYSRNYSSQLVHEFTATTKALNELLPRYKNKCAAKAEKRP